MTDLTMAAVQAYMQHPKACLPIPSVTTNIIPWSYYMYSVLAAVITGAVTGVVGFFVGKRGLTGTQTDLSNAAKVVTNVPTEVQTVATEVKAAV